MAAASVIAFEDCSGTVASWQYDDALLVMTGLNVVVPPGAPVLHLSLSIHGVSLSRDCEPGTNQTIVAPSAPTVAAAALGVTIAGVDFVGGTVDGQLAVKGVAVV